MPHQRDCPRTDQMIHPEQKKIGDRGAFLAASVSFSAGSRFLLFKRCRCFNAPSLEGQLSLGYHLQLAIDVRKVASGLT